MVIIERVYFDGKELTQFITVTSDFHLWQGADFDPQFSKNEILSGAEFNYTRFNAKTIPVPFYNVSGTFQEYNQLMAILNVDEPKELRFSSLPNVTFQAIPSGNIDYDKLNRTNGKGTINFIIVDGLAHSKLTRTFEFTENEQGTLEAEIINEGSEEVTVNYEIKLKKESGFVGIVSEYGAMQYGLKEETDKVYEHNATLNQSSGYNFSSWKNGTTFYENTFKKTVTNMIDSEKGLGVLPAGFTNSAGGGQYGAIKELTLTETATNWYIWAKAWFETGRFGQTGNWCLTVLDEDNYLIAGMALEKGDTTGNAAKVQFLLGDGVGGSRNVHIDFTPSIYLKDNPYGEESKNAGRNTFDIKKVDDKITFFFYGKYYPYTESRVKTKKAAKVQFFVGQNINRTSEAKQFITHHYLDEFKILKLNVERWVDIPNRYSAGSTLMISGEEGRLYVNNQIAENDEILGTKYFKVPPGKTKVQLLVSDFSEVESATATIEEAYI
ncbi:distal tail protein Dit [Streptococcus gallolyticus]|uniref:distal tail protein Dit n=1 Tax=Streptococcus gallolyticus TaxID=315405 RepID=UPI0022849BB9|nr:distal tail protein Dit [Streptococcus gallolyticus]MCY7185727.1 phage tail family protein [Streptococcus gallolyticus subsp. gallolyticus]MCY7188941.1 phage tail family protein [Streptococcus gallolyticus subsp. gallolyticus]